jgi:type IV pilus assembly protein PilZ
MAREGEQSPESDRRKEQRTPIELRVEYKRLNSFFADYTKNISKGGTFICTDRPLPIGTEFLFKLIVPTLEKPLSIKGRVHWIVTPENATEEQAAGMGIGFLYDSESERKLIEHEVGELMIKSLGPVLYHKLMDNR